MSFWVYQKSLKINGLSLSKYSKAKPQTHKTITANLDDSGLAVLSAADSHSSQTASRALNNAVRRSGFAENLERYL